MRLESLWGDLRFAFRIFKRSPAIALTVIGTLAVALGLNATADSFFNAYVVKPAAVRDPGTLYQASWENRGGFFHWFSWPEAQRFGREMAGVFPETSASVPFLPTRINGRPAMGELVTGNYFSVLGVPAFRGRMLQPSDSAAPGREPVVVLSHAGWMRHFSGDPAAIGQQLQIRGVSLEIVGIAPEGFAGLDVLPRDFRAPLTLLPAFEEGPSLFGPEPPQSAVTRNRSNETALATLRAHPLVRAVAAASTSTFGAGQMVIASDADAPSAVQVRMPQKLVSPGYFDFYEIGLVSGRQFTEAEASDAAAPLVILSEQAAATLWPGQNAVGRRVRLTPDSRLPDAFKPPYPVVEVVGVARTVFTSWDAAMRASIYSPMSVVGFNLNMLVKTRGGNVWAAMRQIDADLSAAAPGVAEQIITAQDLVEGRVYPFQAISWAAGIIGGIALVLTISGIYGVIAYAVARRTKEIGIRMALGESAAGVVGLILKQSMRLCAIGLVIGLTLAAALSRALASTLVMMDTFDVAAFAAGIVIVSAACLVAAFSPARRAAGVEPWVALRID